MVVFIDKRGTNVCTTDMDKAERLNVGDFVEVNGEYREILRKSFSVDSGNFTLVLDFRMQHSLLANIGGGVVPC